MGGGEEEGERLEMASLPIPDELLAEIFLRLPFPADLARASAGCVSFRRVAADRSFLRRYRKLHAPPLLGFFHKNSDLVPAIAPHPSASAASAVALAADFTFDFLPPPWGWFIEDSRDGRVLLSRYTSRTSEAVVCDPLYRRYILLPPLAREKDVLLRLDFFLVPSGCGVEAATADETSFRVISMAQYKTRLVVFAFSSSTRQWRAIPSRLWTDLSAGLPPLTEREILWCRQYAYGCFYWIADEEESKNRLLVLDTKTMEFSIAEPPQEAKSYNFSMVEAGEGRPGMFVLESNAYYRDDISYFIRQSDGGSHWQKVKTISLNSWATFLCNMEKYLFLHYQGNYCFMLDIETFHLEKVCPLGRATKFDLHAYSNFPPSLLSSPTISSGINEGP